MFRPQSSLTTGIAILLTLSLLAPGVAFAATKKVTTPPKKPVAKKVVAKPVLVPLVFSGWVPYWKKTDGTAEAVAHFKSLDEVSPFSYEVDPDGSIVDTAKLSEGPWPGMIATAKAKNVKVIPTVIWHNKTAIYDVLSATTTRAAHVDELVAIASESNYAGIDIDYENKSVETRYYFSQFLTELSTRLHAKKRVLVCTIEARTPVSSRFTVPKTVEYVNDYKIIGKVCDTVRIMTYDQMNDDIRLVASNDDQLYMPVADNDWVEKVIANAIIDIPKSKVMIGAASYGYEYRVTNNAEGFERLRAISAPDALALAATQGITPARNAAGERSFSYNKNGELRYVTWSDGTAILQKFRIARKLGVRGVSLFKFDGQIDPALWKLLGE